MTCGGCNLRFPLTDMPRFMHHKMAECSNAGASDADAAAATDDDSAKTKMADSSAKIKMAPPPPPQAGEADEDDICVEDKIADFQSVGSPESTQAADNKKDDFKEPIKSDEKCTESADSASDSKPPQTADLDGSARNKMAAPDTSTSTTPAADTDDRATEERRCIASPRVSGSDQAIVAEEEERVSTASNTVKSGS